MKSTIKLILISSIFLTSSISFGRGLFVDAPTDNAELQDSENSQRRALRAIQLPSGSSGATSYGVSYAELRARASRGFDCRNRGNELECMTCNCFHEARGERVYNGKGINEAQVNIARVMYSRVLSSSFPMNNPPYTNTACGVVHDKTKARRGRRSVGQFSWTTDAKKVNRTIGPGIDGFNACVKSVYDSLPYKNVYFGDHYHTTGVSPRWRSTCTVKRQVGAHIFYSYCDWTAAGAKRLMRGSPGRQQATPGVAKINIQDEDYYNVFN